MSNDIRLSTAVSFSRTAGSRGSLLYGVWRTADGIEILFDRRYRPRWRRTPRGTVAPANPNEWIENIAEQSWFYNDRCPMPSNRYRGPTKLGHWGRNVTIPLSAAERTKLAKLLGMLGSDHLGERDAAAIAANKLITRAGITWEQVIDPSPVEKPQHELATWRTTCAKLQKRPGDLRTWERGFIADLPRFQQISPKQRHCLNEIARRVLGGRT